MTPPNELEQLAQFQDAIQSDEGLERLRAMQYLQQMNNQGIMGLPQVTQQPIVQRENGGTTKPELSAFAGLGHTVDNIGENLTTEDLSAAIYVGARGGSNDDRLIAQQIIGIFRQSNPKLVDEMFQVEQDEIDYEESKERREMIEGVQDNIGGGLENIQEILGARQGRASGGQVISRQYGGEVGTGGLVGLTADGTQIFDNSQEGALNRATHGGILEGYNYTPSTGGTSTATGTLTTGHPGEQGYKLYDGIIQKDDPMDAPGTLAADSSYGARLPKDAIEGTALYNLDPVQQRGGIYNAHDVRDSGMSLIRPADAPVTIIQEQTQTPHRDPYTGKIPYDLWHAPVVNDFGQGYDLKDMDYFTANALALKEGATRFKYNNEYARVDPGLLSNYDYSNLGTKPYSYVDNLAINQPNVAFNKIHSGMAADPNSQAAKSAQGLYPGLYGGWSDTPGAGNTPYPVVPNFRPGIDQGGPYGITTQIQASGKRPAGYYMRREGGPVIERFNGGLTNLRGAEGLKETVNYMEEGTIQEANAMAMAENQPSFMFQNQLYETGTMTPIRENTQQGILDRATQGGIVETPNMFRGYGPRYQSGIGGKITDTFGSNEPPQPVNLPIQSQDVTNAFMPTNMVEYTPPFYGGGMMPQPMMVPADEQGNPIMPISKQAMTAEQGGYVQNLAGGGIVGNRELQQLQEGGLVDLPVVKMGFGGFLKSVFRAPARIVKGIAKGVKGIVKSKTFKALAPLVLAVAAPYALGALAPSVFGAGATMFGGALSTTGALGYGLTTGLGSMVGNLLGGAKFGDAARQGLLSGATAGVFKGIGSGNWMGTGRGVGSGVGTMGQKGFSKTGSALMEPSKNLPGYGPASNIGAASRAGTTQVFDYGSATAAKPTQLVYEPAQQGTTVYGSNNMTGLAGADNVSSKLSPTVDSVTPISRTAESIVPTSPVADVASPSTWDQVKQVGQDIYKDYGNWKGAAKLVGMDMMQPDWDQVYADEKSMEQQLQDMGYTIDTGFDGQRVIRDSSGVTLPSNLSVQDILDRALGRTPRTRLADRIGFEPNTAAQGGLVSLAGGGEFSGMVEGDGHGMEDNVYMPIKERGHGKQIGTLAVSPSEYVVDAHTMSALGNGNPDAGAKVMDNVIASVRKKAYGTTQQPNEINGLNALMPMMQGGIKVWV